MVKAQRLAISQITKNESDALQAFLQKLLAGLGQEIIQVILFGSKARGDSASDSDIDLLILANEENRRLREAVSVMSSQIGLDYDVLLNTFLVAEKRWRQMSLERFSICRNVERDGIELFARLAKDEI